MNKSVNKLLHNIWFDTIAFLKLVLKEIEKNYQDYKRHQKIMVEKRKYYAEIEKENYHAGVGYTKGVFIAENRERIRYKDEQHRKKWLKNYNAIPDIKPDYVYSKPKKKRRKIW